MTNETDETVIPEYTSMTAPIHHALLGKLLLKAGAQVPAGELEQACASSQPEGASLKPFDRVSAILKALQKKSLRVAQMTWDRLDQRHLPVLAFFDGEWRLAIKEDNDGIILTKSDGNSMAASSDDLAEAIVIWIQAQAGEQGTAELLQSSASSLLITEMLKDKRWIVEVFVATVIVNILAVATSLFSMQVYDRVVPTFAYSTLVAMVTGMVIMVSLDWILKYIRSRILDDVAKQVDISLSQRLFEHVMALRLDKRPQSLGSLAAQMNGLETVRNFFSSTIVFAMTDLPFGIMFIAIIWTIGGLVSMVYLVLLPVSLLLGWLAQRKLKELARLEIQRGHERHGLLVDTIQGAETIQSTGSSWRFADLWKGITVSMAGYSLKSKMITSHTTTTTATLGTVAYVAAVVVGVMQIEAGHLTTGGLIACTILGGKVISPIAQSVSLLVQWQHVRESLGMVNRLLAMEACREEGRTLMMPDFISDSLQLEGVRFTYPHTPVVRLQIANLSLNSGDRVVLMGPNGCGKSTLLKVAAGLYKPTEGQVRIGGADLWMLDPQTVNERIGYLPQDVHLFKGTLKSNIALCGGVSDARLIEVCQQLGIDKLAADSPRSMDMEISEGGHGLSGGQRQLVGLSRIFLARPRIWLMDEPSASLDMESENRLLDAIQKNVLPTDILMIATHRPRLMSLATRLIVMRRGQVVADGSPGDVIQSMQSAQSEPTASSAATAV
ncbi:MAG: ATP-binding cassette domain-containing protein [Geobacteraceae bacterium]|nr:ATP-binding cassette domain-containing protein [Geobacteraceae bacterium]